VREKILGRMRIHGLARRNLTNILPFSHVKIYSNVFYIMTIAFIFATRDKNSTSFNLDSRLSRIYKFIYHLPKNIFQKIYLYIIFIYSFLYRVSGQSLPKKNSCSLPRELFKTV